MTIVHVAEAGSTNTDLLARAAAGIAGEGDWLVAGRQSAGRGRSGRTWASPPGNLYASGLVRLGTSDPPAPTLALVAGIALIDALDVPGLVLKWPNDVLSAKAAKLAGVLLERERDHVAIGIGVNLAHHPALAARTTTSLAALGLTIAPNAAIERIATAFARWLSVWRATGLGVVRAAWLDRAHPLGTPLAAALPDASRLAGTFGGLSEDCALRLVLPDGGVRVIHAGDVSLI